MKKIFLLILILTFSTTSHSKKNTSSIVQSHKAEKRKVNSLENGELQGLYNNGEYAPHIDLVNSATKTLDIEIYEMFDPSFVQAVQAAFDRGVRVRIIKEPRPVGDKCNTFDFATKKKKKDKDKPLSCQTEKDLMTALNSKEGNVFKAFNKKELCGQKVPPMNDQCVEHGKMIIVDGERALLSSGNFNSSSLCSKTTDHCNRDYSYISKNAEQVSALLKVFEKDLEAKRYDPTEILPKSVTISPYSLEPLSQFINSIPFDNQVKTIQIQNQYLKDPKLNLAIKSAAKKQKAKVEVMISNLLEYSPHIKPGVQKNLCCIMTDFEKSGVEVRIFTPEMKIKEKRGYLHAKSIVVEDDKGKRAWMGSVNGSTQSLNQNREFGIFFDDAPDVEKLSRIMREDFKNPLSKSWKEQLDCSSIDIANSCSQNQDDADTEDSN